jgi:hypothetical protein
VKTEEGRRQKFGTQREGRRTRSFPAFHHIGQCCDRGLLRIGALLGPCGSSCSCVDSAINATVRTHSPLSATGGSEIPVPRFTYRARRRAFKCFMSASRDLAAPGPEIRCQTLSFAERVPIANPCTGSEIRPTAVTPQFRRRRNATATGSEMSGLLFFPLFLFLLLPQFRFPPVRKSPRPCELLPLQNTASPVVSSAPYTRAPLGVSSCCPAERDPATAGDV